MLQVLKTAKFFWFFLVVICAISLFLNLWQKRVVPLGFNTDEAAFGYNSYSIAKTGLDEFGKLPLRLTSFGDFKMPLYSLLSAPIIGVLGLNEFSCRFLNTILAALFPLLFFATLKKLDVKSLAALIATLLFCFCFALVSIGRQAHEGYLSAFLSLCVFYNLLHLLKKPSVITAIIYALLLGAFLHSYQSARAVAALLSLPVFVIFGSFVIPAKFLQLSPGGCGAIFRTLQVFKTHHKSAFTLVLLLTIVAWAVFIYGDILYPPARVKTLLIWNNPGFIWGIEHARALGGSALLHNKFTHAVAHILYWHTFTFSPYFLGWAGDANPRFGLAGLAPITLAEYALFIFATINLAWNFAKNIQFKMPLIRQLAEGLPKGGVVWLLITLIVFTSPITSSITFQTQSVTRILSVFPFIFLLIGYAINYLLDHKQAIARLELIAILAFATIQNIYTYYNYFNTYPQNAKAIASWSPQTRQLANLLATQNIKKYNKVFVGNKLGMAHIFYAFYNKLDPRVYAASAQRALTPDEYGFTKVTAIDNMIFSTPSLVELNKGDLLVLPYEEYASLKRNKGLELERDYEVKLIQGTLEATNIYILAKK